MVIVQHCLFFRICRDKESFRNHLCSATPGPVLMTVKFYFKLYFSGEHYPDLGCVPRTPWPRALQSAGPLLLDCGNGF